MRWLAALVWIGCGCRGSGSIAASDAAADVVSPCTGVCDAAWAEARPTTNVLVGAMHVAWTQAHEHCGLEEGPYACVTVGPTLSSADLATGTVTTLVENKWGAEALAGDDAALFFVTQDDATMSSYLARFRPGVSSGIEPMSSLTSDSLSNVIVDATYVYWYAQALGTGTSRILRATRNGDGSDAMPLAQFVGLADDVTMFAGYLWLDASVWNGTSSVVGLYRIPVTGGPMELVSSTESGIGAASGVALYATALKDPQGYQETIGTIAADMTWQVVFDPVQQWDGPIPGSFLVDGDELFWISDTGQLHRAHTTDSTWTLDLAYTGSYEPFAVAPNAILFNFTRRGYESIPR